MKVYMEQQNKGQFWSHDTIVYQIELVQKGHIGGTICWLMYLTVMGIIFGIF